MNTSKQRVLDAANHKVSDRTAITFDAEKEVYDLLYKHISERSKAKLFDFLRCDTWMVLPNNYITPAMEQAKKEKTTIWGWKTQTAVYSGGTYEELAWSPLAGKDELTDIDNHVWPDPSIQGYDHFAADIAAGAK